MNRTATTRKSTRSSTSTSATEPVQLLDALAVDHAPPRAPLQRVAAGGGSGTRSTDPVGCKNSADPILQGFQHCPVGGRA